jgi:hypothetical protein
MVSAALPSASANGAEWNARRVARTAPLRLIQQYTDASEAAALVLAIQDFVANGGERPWSAPPQCWIAGADGQPWPCRSASLVAFQGTVRSGWSTLLQVAQGGRPTARLLEDVDAWERQAVEGQLAEMQCLLVAEKRPQLLLHLVG